MIISKKSAGISFKFSMFTLEFLIFPFQTSTDAERTETFPSCYIASKIPRLIALDLSAHDGKFAHPDQTSKYLKPPTLSEKGGWVGLPSVPYIDGKLRVVSMTQFVKTPIAT